MSVYKREIWRFHDETNIKINLGSSKIGAYKDESSIGKNPKKKKTKRKNILLFSPKHL
jgi:hypothetical protein